MAKQKAKNKNAWDRAIIWAEQNQKVIMVVFLLVMAPSFAMTTLYTNVLTPKADSEVVKVVYAQPITRADFKKTTDEIGRVRALLYTIARTNFTNPLPQLLASSGLSWEEMDVVQYYAYKKKALDMGIRVPDDELREYIHELWQCHEAARRAAEDLSSRPPPSPSDQNANLRRYMEHMELSRKKLEDLRSGDGKYFDEEAWRQLVEGREDSPRHILVRDFEETLRDFCVIAKLENYVKSSVRVSPQEVFEVYRKEKAKRKLSWTELKLPDALKEKVAKTLTPDEVKSYYEASKDLFKKGLSLRASWLLLPQDHFKAEAEKAVTEDDLKKYYEENRHEFRRPVLLSSESDFAVLKPDEKAARDAQLYKPFDEVKDKVREKVIENRTQSDISAFSGQLGQRINPLKPPGDASKAAADKPAVSFDDLVKEFPFLKTGSTGYVEQKKVKETFGDGYSAAVDGWFRNAQANKPINPLKNAIRADKGQIFYTKPDVRQSGFLPLQKEIEDEVRDSLAKQRALDLIEKAAKAASDDVNGGKKDLTAVQTAGLDVEISGEKVHVDASLVQSSSTFIAKEGSIMVPKKKPEKPEEKKPSKPADDDDELDASSDEEALPASKTLLDAVFTVSDGDKQKTAVASDAEASACYVVRFDDQQLPNPAGFEKQKDQLEKKLLAESSQLYFAEWRKGLLKEALPRQDL